MYSLVSILQPKSLHHALCAGRVALCCSIEEIGVLTNHDHHESAAYTMLYLYYYSTEPNSL